MNSLDIPKFFSQKATIAREQIGCLLDVIVTQASKIIPYPPSDAPSMQEGVWADLSVLYYKYDQDIQKRAFREVMKEMTQIISEERWPTAYKKIYRSNKTTPFP